MFNFGKHIRELVVHLLSQNLIGQDHFLASFSRGDTLGIFFLTVYVTIKIPRISLHITHQVMYIQIVLLPNICFYFSS